MSHLHHHIICLGTPKSVIKQLEMGRSSAAATDKERTVHVLLKIYLIQDQL